MTHFIIRLRSLSQVHDFVRRADQCDFDVNIGYDRVTIDAKSLVGVMGLDLGRKLTVSFSGENRQFEEYLSTIQIPA